MTVAIESHLSARDLDRLNHIFGSYSIEERLHGLYDLFSTDEVLYTSSFGTKSVLLLYYISRINPQQQVHFIDTTYHFPETMAYRDALVERLGLNLVSVRPNQAQNELTREEQWWQDHPRMCCAINKITPLEPIIARHKIWISGLMAYQTLFRSTLKVFEQQGDIIKFHPFIDLNREEFERQMEALQLPRHPLEVLGYNSIGCVHCTEKGSGREGRWQGTGKTECGLHPHYFKQK